MSTKLFIATLQRSLSNNTAYTKQYRVTNKAAQLSNINNFRKTTHK